MRWLETGRTVRQCADADLEAVATHTGFERVLQKFEKCLACAVIVLTLEESALHDSKRMDVQQKRTRGGGFTN